MISLATTSTTTRVSPEAGEAKPLNGAKGSFSALLAEVDPEAAQENGLNPVAETAEAAADAAALSAVLTGIALPVAAESGKELPVALPELAEGTEGEAEAETAKAALALTAMPQLPLPAPAQGGEADETSPAPAARPAIQQQAIAAQAAARPDTGEQAPAGERASGSPRETAVSLHVAQPTGGQAADDAAAGGEAEGDALASRPERAAVRFIQTETARQPEQATPATASQPSSINSAPAAQPAGQVQRIDTLQELTRIVDRLAAARQVFAPVAEALAIEHAEFGELSLRFDQRRDGGLSVQLSASNPEAQRAVAQAVGAQGFQMAADDRAGTGPQSQSQNSARGAGTEREGTSGNGNTARNEQNASRQQDRAAQPNERGAGAHTGTARAGIFA